MQQNQAVEVFAQQFAQLPFEQQTAQQITTSVKTTVMNVKDHVVDGTIIKQIM